MTTLPLESRPRTVAAPASDAIVLALDAGSHGPRAVESLLLGVVDALGAQGAPTFASTHVVEHEGIHHVGALVFEEPPWRLDLLEVAQRVAPPEGATLCRMTRHGARLAGHGGRPVSAVVTAAREAASGDRGRVVTFPGQDGVAGVVRVERLLATTAVEEVVGLAGTPVDPLDAVDTGGWLRPRWNAGRLELLVERSVGGVLRPFEQQAQIACCSDHRAGR